MSLDQGTGLTVLCVCTANECRSPMAEHLFARQVEWRRLDWTVRSAGTRAVGGVPMHKSARRALRRRGVQVDPDWRSTTLTVDLLDQADLILVADQRNWSTVVGRRPEVANRTFLLLHFARLIAAGDEHGRGVVGDRSAADLVAAARRMQSRIQPVPLAQLDLVDPIGEPYRKFRACAERIDAAAEQIFDARPRRTTGLAP